MSANCSDGQDRKPSEERVLDLLRTLLDRYRSYHDHKESMAYAGLTLYLAAFGAGLLTKDWPPAWISQSKATLIVAVSCAWLLVLRFVKWELLRRRWAAMRVAGIERLLARWSTGRIPPEELAAWSSVDRPKPSMSQRLKGVALRATILVIDQIVPPNLRQAEASVAPDRNRLIAATISVAFICAVVVTATAPFVVVQLLRIGSA